MCIVNTCTVTAKSDYQSRQCIRRALRTGAEVFVTGCYSQLNSKTITKISDSIRIIPNEAKGIYFNENYRFNESSTLSNNHTRSRAFIKIQDGCNNRCTYCSIRIARGPSRSVAKESIIRTINEAFYSGINEVVLTGVHIGMYGADVDSSASLPGLIKDILKATGMPRIRLSSLEVNEINDDILELLTDSRICKHLHIPLQSGDDKILSKMARHYTVRAYKEKIDQVLSSHSEISIGTDVIVGFPGEDDSSFERSFEFIEQTGFSYLHVFPFSRRRLTAAYHFDDQVEPNVKQQRARRLRELSARKKRDYMTKFAGRTLDLIVEDKIQGDSYNSTSGNYLRAMLNGQALKKGSLVSGKITMIENGMLFAEVT
ncbi:MAG: tRNA (N(6)-L-threonylcarbamoyladenosine(37)-C(2))-methylthiotransferase MtaB [Ignavibacteria bacterium]